MMFKYLKNFFFLLLIVISNIGWSQSKQVWLYQADYDYVTGHYPTALVLYQKVLDDSLGMSFDVLPYEIMLANQKINKLESKQKKDTTKKVKVEDYVRHQIAMCYRQSKDYQRAVEHFTKSTEIGAFPDDYYYLGSSYMNLGDYQKALEVFEHYTSKVDNASDEMLKRALQDMTACNFALKYDNSNDVISVSFADTTIFNKGTTSFATSYWGENRMVFTSARAGGVILDPEKQDSRYLLDLYWVNNESGEWGELKNFGRPLNSSGHEASGHFSNENFIYFTRWNEEKPKEKSIYVAREFGLSFFESQKLDSVVNEPGYISINPYFDNESRWLYFSSNKPGGVGGMDIWRVQIDSMGNPMGKSENLGKPVNTEYDEVSPFYHNVARTLYFSSNGHENFGGLDVFKSSYDIELRVFKQPKNMGQPINSTKDDSYYIVDDNLRTGFVSSDRDICSTNETPYGLCASCYHIYNVKMPELHFKVSGYVYDKNTDEIIPNVRVNFKDVAFQWEHFYIFTDSNGYYEHELIPNVEVFLKATKKDYFADAGIVSTVGETESKAFTQDFYLEKIPKGEITIRGIEYDFDKATLRPESKIILDSLIMFLELNDNISIEIRSHTDQRGSDAYNLDLSHRRAQSVVNYLIANGISKDRLIAKGYGETEPAEVPVNGELVKMTQEYIDSLPTKQAKNEAYQRNRRTAFKVISQNKVGD
ncbi:MAG TPA: tetratricopeptide repeat protein [Crocinitomix sp.]|nr:tetratricopeptide repeat protein [Crocinitomix sp.]